MCFSSVMHSLPPPMQVRAELLSKTREIPPDMVEVRIKH